MEPERRIEKLLRAFAKKRREQAGDAVELRSAARQRLQQEISRRSPEKTGGFFSNFFLALRPRLAFALCFVAVVCVGGWLLLPVFTGRKPATLGSANSQVAKASLPERAQPMLPASSPVSAPPPVIESEKRNALEYKEKVVSGAIATKPTQSTQAPVDRESFVFGNGMLTQESVLEKGIAETNSVALLNAPAAPPSHEEMSAAKADAVTVDSFASASTSKKDTAERPLLWAAPPTDTNLRSPALTLAAREPDTQKTSAMEKAPPASSPNGALFDANLKAESPVAAGAVASQNFYRLNVPAARQRASRTLSAPTTVLRSFRVEQNGGEMRVVDMDGSVYTGVVQVARDAGAPIAGFSGRFQNESAVASVARTRQTPAIQNYFFRVSGTNRNLKQNVVFSGNLIPLTPVPLPRTNAGAVGGAGGAGRAMPDSSGLLLLSNSRISGKAVIGDQKEIEVNAAPAPQ